MRAAEAIAQAYPVLTLEQVYGALTFYLANRAEVDDYLASQRADFETKRAAAREAPETRTSGRGSSWPRVPTMVDR